MLSINKIALSQASFIYESLYNAGWLKGTNLVWSNFVNLPQDKYKTLLRLFYSNNRQQLIKVLTELDHAQKKD